MDIMLDLAGSVSATGGLVLLAEQRESVSLGLLVLMEQLSPTERAAFILRDAFGSSHRDVAELVGVNEENSRQLHRRARRQVPQGRVGSTATPRDLARTGFAARQSAGLSRSDKLPCPSG